MKNIIRKPTSCTSPPKCLHVRPWLNSWRVVAATSVSHATKSVSHRSVFGKCVTSSFAFTQTSTNAEQMNSADDTTNAGVQTNHKAGASQLNSRSGSNADLRQ